MDVTASGAEALPRLHAATLHRAVVRIRVWLRHRRLDAMLAEDADPWSSRELLLRASQLAAHEDRRITAGRLRTLVQLADRRLPASPYLNIRYEVVVEHRALFLELAAHLAAPQPAPLGLVARLKVLVEDERSPVYCGGRPARTLDGLLSHCIDLVGVEDA